MKELQSIKLKGYKGTWSMIDKFFDNGTIYYLFESDIYGDEAEGLLTDENLNVVYEGYDDIRTMVEDYKGDDNK